MSEVTELWRVFSGAILAKCRRVLGDTADAQDVTQETFIRYWQQGRTLEPERALGWLYQTATHLCVDSVRRRAVHQRAVPHATTVPDAHGVTESRLLIARLAADISAEVLEAAVLARVDGLTQAEVAQVLRVSERTVRRLLTRFDEALAATGVKESP